MASKRCRWKSIDPNVGAIALTHMAELGLSIICLDPKATLHQIDDLDTRCDQLSGVYMKLPNGAIGRGKDLRVAQIDLRDSNGSFPGLYLSEQPSVFRVQRGSLLLCPCESSLSACCGSLGLRQICLMSLETCHDAQPRRLRLLELLLCCRRFVERRLLGGELRFCLINSRLCCSNGGMRSRHCGPRLFDTRLGRGNTRIRSLLRILIPRVLSLCACQGGFCLLHDRLVVGVIKFDEQLACLNGLIVIHSHTPHGATDSSTQRCLIRSHVCVVCLLNSGLCLGGCPATSDEEKQNHRYAKHHDWDESAFHHDSGHPPSCRSWISPQTQRVNSNDST